MLHAWFVLISMHVPQDAEFDTVLELLPSSVMALDYSERYRELMGVKLPGLSTKYDGAFQPLLHFRVGCLPPITDAMNRGSSYSSREQIDQACRLAVNCVRSNTSVATWVVRKLEEHWYLAMETMHDWRRSDLGKYARVLWYLLADRQDKVTEMTAVSKLVRKNKEAFGITLGSSDDATHKSDGRSSNYSSTRPDTDMKCFKCDKKGHRQRDCRMGQRPMPMQDKKCFACGKRGHIQANCRSSQRKDGGGGYGPGRGQAA
jgi:hypothetical protein